LREAANVGAKRLLAGDFGGTRARVALLAAPANGGQPVVEEVAVYPARDFAGPGEVAARFLAVHGSPEVAAACFGVAGAVSGNRAWLTNLGWAADGGEIARQLSIAAVELINDLVATGLGMGYLGHDDVFDLNPMAVGGDGTAVLIGVGTGLGMALLVRSEDGVVVAPSEAGHVELAARDEQEWALRRFVERRLGGRVSVERVASGSGLPAIWDFLIAEGEIRPAAGMVERVAREDAGAVIGEAALAGSCPVAVAAVRLFSSVLGSFAGDMALAVMARGGIYLGGGVAPRLAPRLADGTFLRAFTDKGRLSSFVEPLPVRVILRQDTGLLGAGRRAAELARLEP
jgi:glucokinase